MPYLITYQGFHTYGKSGYIRKLLNYFFQAWESHGNVIKILTVIAIYKMNINCSARTLGNLYYLLNHIQISFLSLWPHFNTHKYNHLNESTPQRLLKRESGTRWGPQSNSLGWQDAPKHI